METGLLILNEAVKDTYEDDGVPMLSRSRIYLATQEEEALTRLLNLIQRGMPNPSTARPVKYAAYTDTTHCRQH